MGARHRDGHAHLTYCQVPDTVDDLSHIYQQISDELSSQYTLGYISKNPLQDGRWRSSVVRVDRPDVSTHTKRGYYAPSIR